MNRLSCAVGFASVLAVSIGGYLWSDLADANRIPYTSVRDIAEGERVYLQHCASCHGVDLRGEPTWQRRDVNGLLPAPPHDSSGHTWHHDDQMLFEFVKYGPQRFAGADYQSKMPAYAEVLPDRAIWAVLAYIKSTWPDEIIRRHNRFSE